MASALKMTAICMLILTTGQLMATAGAKAPLVQADAAPTARRLLSADHERSASGRTSNCPCTAMTPWCCFGLQRTATENCPCTARTPWCCSGLQKTALEDCPCSPFTPWCCSGLQKTALENCPCTPMTPFCCFGAGSAATN
ncbi:uncharacterized protein LOC100279083 precursor [Zea mays]|uniref:Uncharacterized protein n=1 Tax=Zea mays TaxID=4577 RepID=B6UHK1_MAIZE|nr:uncharacterized protein LOC100279083 precursor [Zea mays]ACG48834.1 hypothetical protein [Zea mays]|eukprot:NP_001145605.1 uncharacterized protein LOC100279083 precursor [Zea mays]